MYSKRLKPSQIFFARKPAQNKLRKRHKTLMNRSEESREAMPLFVKSALAQINVYIASLKIRTVQNKQDVEQLDAMNNVEYYRA